MQDECTLYGAFAAFHLRRTPSLSLGAMSERVAELQTALANVADPILRQSLYCLLDHFHPEWGDLKPLDVFNRLLAKNLRPAGASKTMHTDIRIEQISSRREQWTTAALAGLRCGHSDPTGVDIPCPIVLAEYDGEQRVLDGNHRINRWKSTGDKRIHDVNIHTIAGIAGLVDLPPDANGA
jgi:hypothetical protein